ncbi:TetR/AcrR family transcriptional regulator [Nocardia sp. NPDC059246]|uniref:TetR/AcrR family transcriptional regulator n=1 Tax=unclassified Nocardia TaxID=2637762 RepID=UPI0036993FB6
MPRLQDAVDARVPGRPAGRPRDTARHRAVLTATRELLGAHGYAGLNYSDIASRAGVTRQLLYRWWPNRAALVSEALFANPEDHWPARYPGPLAADLRLFIAALVDYICRPDVRAGILGLMTEADHVTDMPGLEAGTLGPLETALRTIVDAAHERGEIDCGSAEDDPIDPRLTLNTLRGAVVMHLIADQTPPDLIIGHLTQLTVRALTAHGIPE